jgi:hypothetical protein
MTDRPQVITSDIHKVLIRDTGGWMDIVPGSLNFVYVVLLEPVTLRYLYEFGSYTFITADDQIYHIPADAVIGMQLNPPVVEEPEDPPVEEPETPEE